MWTRWLELKQLFWAVRWMPYLRMAKQHDQRNLRRWWSWRFTTIPGLFTFTFCLSAGLVNFHLVCWYSVTKLCPTLCNPVDCSPPGFPVLHYLPEFAQTQVHWVGNAISSSVTPFSSGPQSFPATGSFPMSQFFASGTKVLELQLQHQSFQTIFRVDFL